MPLDKPSERLVLVPAARGQQAPALGVQAHGSYTELEGSGFELGERWGTVGGKAALSQSESHRKRWTGGSRRLMKPLGRSRLLTDHIERSGQRAVDLVQSGPSDQVLNAASSNHSAASKESRPGRPGSAWIAAGLAFLLCWGTIIGLDLALRHHELRVDFAGINGLLVGCAGILAALLGTLIIALCLGPGDTGR